MAVPRPVLLALLASRSVQPRSSPRVAPQTRAAPIDRRPTPGAPSRRPKPAAPRGRRARQAGRRRPEGRRPQSRAANATKRRQARRGPAPARRRSRKRRRAAARRAKSCRRPRRARARQASSSSSSRSPARADDTAAASGGQRARGRGARSRRGLHGRLKDLADYRPVLAGCEVSQVPSIVIVRAGSAGPPARGLVDGARCARTSSDAATSDRSTAPPARRGRPAMSTTQPYASSQSTRRVDRRAAAARRRRTPRRHHAARAAAAAPPASSPTSIVELGFLAAGARRRRGRGGQGHGPVARGRAVQSGALSTDQLARATAERFGLDHVDLTVYKPDLAAVNLLTAQAARRYNAVPVGFHSAGHAARGDGRPVERARARRPQADDGLRDPPGGRLARGHRGADRQDEPPRRRGRRGRSTRTRGGRRGRRRDPRVGRRRAGHQARQLDHRPGDRGRRLGHPLRARTAATCACASASTACCTRPPRSRAAWCRASSRA